MEGRPRIVIEILALGRSDTGDTALEYKIDPFPSLEALTVLWREAWGHEPLASMSDILKRSLGHVGAYEGDAIVGFVNVAWDGGIHAFILDTCVLPAFRRQGVASRLVKEAIALAGSRGARWLHVDFEPHREEFYHRCGFRPTKAGLIGL
jgi:GNAT superfamily N-acetyltransferase